MHSLAGRPIMFDNMNTPPTKTTDRASKPRYWTRRRILRRLLLLLGLYLGIGVGLAWITVRPKPQKMTTTPDSYGLPFERAAFASTDGTRLAGWFIPSAERRPRGVIVLCHGLDSTREAMLYKAVLLHRHGYAALLFDFRARGESGGDRCTL